MTWVVRASRGQPAVRAPGPGRGFLLRDLMTEIARTGTVRQVPSVPADVRASFVTALEIARLAP
jgi:hypothetical protein